jgi:hypothetical protein
MKKTRLLATLTLSLLAVSVAQSAQYRIVELPVELKGRDTFPTGINASGQISVNVQTPFNPPIDETLIDFELQSLIDNLTDIEAAKAGNPNDEDYEFLLSVILPGDNNQFIQQVSSFLGFIATETDSQFVPGHDRLSVENEYSFSADTSLNSINDLGDTVGSGEGMFYTVPYTTLPNIDPTSGEDSGSQQLNYVINDFLQRGFARINGEMVELPPIAIEAGGVSSAYDLNNNNQVVGAGSFENTSDSLQTQIDICVAGGELNTDNEFVEIDVPLESCLRSLMLSATFSNAFQRRAMMWQLNGSGELISSKAFGMLFTPEPDDEAIYSSQANAINDNGIAVGQAPGVFNDNADAIRLFAVVFNGDEVINISTAPDESVGNTQLRISEATDINNANLVVGQENKSVNGSTRSKFFVHDINTNETVYPEDFFLGSSSIARSINNNNMVVGFGHVDANVVVSQRRNEAFLYDHNNQVFHNINNLVECASPYTVVQANGINDANEIAATATINKAFRNIRGEVVLNDDGTEVMENRIVAVKLVPIPGGEIESCDTSGSEPAERQGASITYISFMTILLLAIRRRKHQN